MHNRDYDVARSPVQGEVKAIIEFKPPRPRYFPIHDTEQLIILESKGEIPLYIRLLHILSQIKVGDKISIGDELGPLIRSGFFDFWTDPHIHIEVRDRGNLIRAKGSLPLSPYSSNQVILDYQDYTLDKLEVLCVKNDYTLLKSTNLSRIDDFWGVGCTIGKSIGVLDCGLPHYTYGGVYLTSSNCVQIGDLVKIQNIAIGQVKRVYGRLAFFHGSPLSIYINDMRIRGLSLYLTLCNEKTIKVIPEKPQRLPLKKGDQVELSIKSL